MSSDMPQELPRKPIRRTLSREICRATLGIPERSETDWLSVANAQPIGNGYTEQVARKAAESALSSLLGKNLAAA